MVSFASRAAVFRWLLGSALVVLASYAGMSRSAAQVSPPVQLRGAPEVPKTIPLLGQPPDANVASAAAADDTDTVNLLLAQGISPDETDANGRTGLIYAATDNNAEIAQSLLSHGAKLDIRDNLGKTALHWAAEYGSVDVMRLLLKANATVDCQNPQGMTPLMLAASKGETAAVRLLLEYHADPKKDDYTGRDAMDWVANNPQITQSLKVAEGE